jgi:Zn-dependent oligopeptidase
MERLRWSKVARRSFAVLFYPDRIEAKVLWSQRVKKSGGLTATNGASFRDKILSRGGFREVMQQCIDFREQEPGIEALLTRRGVNQ